MQTKQYYFILLIIGLLFSGCSGKLDTTKQEVSIASHIDNIEDEDLDEFTDEFEDEFEDTKEGESDPLKGYNVFMTSFNDGFYDYVFNPIASGYNYVVPKGARESIDNFFNNIMYPIRLVNNIFQGKVANATEETGRFVVNTTVGIFGFFDPAKKYLGWEAHKEDFGQTLGYWGVGSGYHIVLPFFGPSNMRDMFSMYPDSMANPITYSDEPLMITAYQKLNYGSLHLEEYEDLRKDAVDLYPFFKDIYEQHRNKLIKE